MKKVFTLIKSENLYEHLKYEVEMLISCSTQVNHIGISVGCIIFDVRNVRFARFLSGKALIRRNYIRILQILEKVLISYV